MLALTATTTTSATVKTFLMRATRPPAAAGTARSSPRSQLAYTGELFRAFREASVAPLLLAATSLAESRPPQTTPGRKVVQSPSESSIAVLPVVDEFLRVRFVAAIVLT